MSFQGTPTEGHQCYRIMQVELDYCFDPETQNSCNPSPLAGTLTEGRTVFFVVQPRYLNVDIRITLDVTEGAADIFISNKPDTFKVFTDKHTWAHDVYLDQNYVSDYSRRLARRSAPAGVVDEAGSIKITDSVPESLKLDASEEGYYDLSQLVREKERELRLLRKRSVIQGNEGMEKKPADVPPDVRGDLREQQSGRQRRKRSLNHSKMSTHVEWVSDFLQKLEQSNASASTMTHRQRYRNLGSRRSHR